MILGVVESVSFGGDQVQRQEFLMLSKCANPSHNTKFKYLREGRLLEFKVAGGAHCNAIPLQMARVGNGFCLL